MRNYSRKEFLKIASLANIGLFAAPIKSWCGPLLPKHSDNVLYYGPADNQYDDLRKGFNKRIDKFPSIIAVCKNEYGVAEAVKFAIANKWPITAKSGGHCMEGSSVNDGGMVINLSLMNKIEWLDYKTANVGPACLLKDLYAEIIPKGRIIPGGSCGGVAMGGLTLGGGYGLLSRQFGMTCDSLLEVTMVDGNGNIVNSSNERHLLWACKGGGNGNFGIVTNMKFTLHPAPATMQSWRFSALKTDAARAKSIFENWFKSVESLPHECFSTCLQNESTTYILLTSTNTSTKAIDGLIANFTALTDKTTHTKPQALNKALKTYFGEPKPLFFKNASAGLYKSFADVAVCIENVLDMVINSDGMIYQVNTVGGNMQNPHFERTAAFANRHFNYFSELQTYWTNEIKGNKLMAEFETIQQMFAQNGAIAQYRNYPDVNFKNWETAYYGNNYASLQKIKTKYDADNNIRSLQSIKL
jgi:hypothetical protein